MTNRYPGLCRICSGRVPAKGGVLFKVAGVFAVAHTACAGKGEPSVITTYFPSTGATVTQNARGRCIDSPCCGCCS